MDLISRIADVIIPVFLIVAIGYGYALRKAPDMTVFNRIALDVLAPLLVYSALAAKDFRIAEHGSLLIGGTVLILGSGVLAWPLAKMVGAQPRTLVPVVMFNNCGNMGLPLALLAFGSEHFGAAVALFSISNLLHFSIGARLTSAAARSRDLLPKALRVAHQTFSKLTRRVEHFEDLQRCRNDRWRNGVRKEVGTRSLPE